MQDTTIQPLGMNIVSPEEGEGTFLQLVIVTGIPLPFADPNTGEPVMAPTGQYRVPLDRDFALKLSDKLREEAEKLPENRKSDLQVASSLSDAAKIAAVQSRMR